MTVPAAAELEATKQTIMKEIDELKGKLRDMKGGNNKDKEDNDNNDNRGRENGWDIVHKYSERRIIEQTTKMERDMKTSRSDEGVTSIRDWKQGEG